jgi:hypothetical protein
MNITLNVSEPVFAILALYAGLGILTAAGLFLLLRSLTLYFYQKTNESKELMKLQSMPKINPKAPEPYLNFQGSLSQLATHIKIIFQRTWTGDVLPSIMTGEGKVVFAAPNDKRYSEIIGTIVLQSHMLMPAYLKKSLYFYFEVKNDDDPEDPGFRTLTRRIFAQAKGLLDSQLVILIERMEKAGPSAVPYIEAMRSYGNVINDIDDLIDPDKRQSANISSPDGTTPTIL